MMYVVIAILSGFGLGVSQRAGESATAKGIWAGIGKGDMGGEQCMMIDWTKGGTRPGGH